MGFVEKILSGRYPRLENLWRQEFDKVIDKAFSQDFDSLTAGAVEPESCDCQRLIGEQWDRLEATRRELDVAKQEKANLQHKLDSARRELQI